MDIGKSFSYVFEDPDWVKKILIGGVINLIPIVNFAATGYGLEELRRTYEGPELPLPEWDNFGGYFVKGLMTFVAGLIYSIPIFLLYCVFFALSMAAGGGTTTSGRRTGGGPLDSIIGILSICLGCLVLLYVIALVFLLPALIARYAITGQFGSFFQFGPAWQFIQSNTGGYVIAVIVFVIASIIAGIVGGIVCGLGAAWTGFWASLVGANLFGNFAKGGASSQLAPAQV